MSTQARADVTNTIIELCKLNQCKSSVTKNQLFTTESIKAESILLASILKYSTFILLRQLHPSNILNSCKLAIQFSGDYTAQLAIETHEKGGWFRTMATWHNGSES